MILHSACEHIAALWVFLADEKHREGAGMECVPTNCCHTAPMWTTGNRKCVLAVQMPLLQWNGLKSNLTPLSDLNSCTCTKRFRGKKTQTDDGTDADDTVWLKETGTSTYCLLSCVCFRVSAGMWWSFLPSELKHKQARKSIPRATTSTESRRCVLSGTQHKDKWEYFDSTAAGKRI